MADLEEIAILAAIRLQELAQQASRLGTGLQNAAPAEKAGGANASIQYLQTVADILSKAAKECIKLGPTHMHDSTSNSE